MDKFEKTLYLDQAMRQSKETAISAVFSMAVAAVSIGGASVVGILFKTVGFKETNIVLMYLIGVFLTACVTRGYFWGVLSAVGATFAFNYFFTAPYYSLNVYDPGYMITFACMTLTSLVTTTLTSRVKQNARKARDKEQETLALYQLTSRLTEAKDLEEIAGIIVTAAGNRFLCEAGCLCCDEDGKWKDDFIWRACDGTMTRHEVLDREGMETFFLRTKGDCEESGEFVDWPINGTNHILGILRLPRQETKLLTEHQKRFLHSLIECASLAMSRIVSVKSQIRSQQEIVQERYRANLLRAISHDLRTPLSGIMGTSEMTAKEDPRYDMTKGILEDAQWLHSLVENILSLTKLQEGRMVLNKQYEAVEEIIGSAIEKMSKRAGDYEINAHIPPEVLMVPMDGKLILQVLINLLDNAVKHSKPEDEIQIYVEKDEVHHQAIFQVADRGDGIAQEDLPNIFQTFYTSQIKPVDARKGIGLGLPICQSIVRAHGGDIKAANRTDGPGAWFIFTLPLEDQGNLNKAMKEDQ